ncbi:MAG: hypothetical protein RSD49_01660 [Hafnia sp.]
MVKIPNNVKEVIPLIKGKTLVVGKNAEGRYYRDRDSDITYDFHKVDWLYQNGFMVRKFVAFRMEFTLKDFVAID